MSAGSTSGIGPVSVRYAAQIRELLYAQAVQRMAAEQEAARQADQDRKTELLQPQPSSDAQTQTQTKTPTPADIAKATPVAPSSDTGKQASAQLLDIQA